jgi:hypothetical protein
MKNTYKIISGSGVNVTPKNYYRKSSAGRVNVAQNIADDTNDTTIIINETRNTMSDTFTPKEWTK